MTTNKKEAKKERFVSVCLRCKSPDIEPYKQPFSYAIPQTFRCERCGFEMGSPLEIEENEFKRRQKTLRAEARKYERAKPQDKMFWSVGRFQAGFWLLVSGIVLIMLGVATVFADVGTGILLFLGGALSLYWRQTTPEEQKKEWNIGSERRRR